LATYMISNYPKDKIENINLFDGDLYLEEIFRKKAFYGTSVAALTSLIAEAVGFEPIHLGPIVNDLNKKDAPPYRASFWPPYDLPADGPYHWGPMMFIQMLEYVKKNLGIDFAQVELLGPNGKPIFPSGYQENFYTQQLEAVEALEKYIYCKSTASEIFANEINPSFKSPYRSVWPREADIVGIIDERNNLAK
jgi:hypothetical protein